MTTLKAINAEFAIDLVKLRSVTFSGVVSDGSNPLRRIVLAYKVPEFSAPTMTFSDATTGSWELNMSCNPNDRIIIMAVGGSGENTQVYDWVVPA